MATKTITITEEAYNKLKVRKKGNESFSEVINRIAPFTDWSDFAGVLSKKSADKLEESIKELRKESEKRAERIARLMQGD